MSAYSTYIFGRDAFMIDDLHGALQEFRAIVQREQYLERWRILHVDGFEGLRLDWVGVPFTHEGATCILSPFRSCLVC